MDNRQRRESILYQVAMPASRSPEKVARLLATQPVVQFEDLQQALDGASPMTTFRYLREVAYRRSYNHNGRYYTRHDPSRYDRHGLWSHGDIHFSRDSTLKDTIVRMVREAEGGMTQRELADRLRVRVHNPLLQLVRDGDLARERLQPGYVYFHADGEVGSAQRQGRQAQLEGGSRREPEVTDVVIIEVLLVLIRYPGSRVGDVAQRLRGRSPPISAAQVRAVFARYKLGEKGGSSIS